MPLEPVHLHDIARCAIDHYTAQLSQSGWCIIPDAMSRQAVEALDIDLRTAFDRTPFSEGGFYGARTKRFGRLLARSAYAAAFVQHDVVLGVANRILSPWCDTIQLNLTQAIAIHPGAPSQLPHRDQDMWQGEAGSTEYSINAMWPFTDYTATNGATLLWPDSHGPQALAPEPREAAVAATMQPGAVLLFLGSTLHGAGANVSNSVRRGMIISYCLGWLRTYENQYLAYPPDTARKFPAELAALVGYRQHRPNLGNFEGCCPSILFNEDRTAALGAVDALRPDQIALVEAFVDGQQRQT